MTVTVTCTVAPEGVARGVLPSVLPSSSGTRMRVTGGFFPPGPNSGGRCACSWGFASRQTYLVAVTDWIAIRGPPPAMDAVTLASDGATKVTLCVLEVPGTIWTDIAFG